MSYHRARTKRGAGKLMTEYGGMSSDSVRSPGHRLLPCSVKKQPQVFLLAKGDHALVAALERLRLAYKPVVEANNKAIAAIFRADPLEPENRIDRVCYTDHILNRIFTDKQFRDVIQFGRRCRKGDGHWSFTYQGMVVITDCDLEVERTMWHE